ncbi:glycosyltransferase [Butyrivibrio sp. AE2032]|uniref:glycosyltransferase n=1 Tax=Butyrivibrio sp. AE2032 TaxID=1458463 RepID=UPI000A417D35|nr:glycosyltransferase [Butyrivibrio sp. AE2032]
MESEIKVLGAIVTYNPNVERICEGIMSLSDSTDGIIIFDNNSVNAIEMQNRINELKIKLHIIFGDSNMGIAFALSEIMKYAQANDYEWVITLDQDSIADERLIYEYKKYIAPGIGAMTCLIRDRGYGSTEYDRRDEIVDVKDCITSGCFMNVEAYGESEGYDASLFIDYVDTDICYSLIENKYRIVRIPYEGLLHEYGLNGKKKRFINREIVVTEHPAWRKYYMARNRIILYKKHPRLISSKEVVVNELGIVIKSLYEKNSLSHILKAVTGIVDGLTYRVSNEN